MSATKRVLAGLAQQKGRAPYHKQVRLSYDDVAMCIKSSGPAVRHGYITATSTITIKKLWLEQASEVACGVHGL
jgi:acyl-CoA hydrolase